MNVMGKEESEDGEARKCGDEGKSNGGRRFARVIERWRYGYLRFARKEVGYKWVDDIYRIF
jgi:hypothetical protein